ncbi:hypothetical protein ACTI_07200 [Actinoplanes sp. OR16]|nr:hypothetical protein ACTI_07200 [Actinoplanes sp. OR16]
MHAEQAEFAELRRQFAGERTLLEPIADVRAHPVRHEAGHRLLDLPFLFAEQAGDIEQVELVSHTEDCAPPVTDQRPLSVMI